MKIGNKNAPHGVAWLTSSGLANDRLVCEFLKLVLGRKGVDLNAEDAKLDSGGLRAKYAAEIATIKVLHMNDGNYHKPSETCRAGRANRVTFFWDLELIDRCGIKAENITKICLFGKPWLFNRPAEDGKYDEQAPNVAGLKNADVELYFAKLAQTQVAIDLVRANKPQEVPKLPSGLSCANELAEISVKLDKKYSAALDKWCAKNFEECDVIVGQGGDVTMVNMALGVNQAFCAKLVKAIKEGQIFFATMSASTMVSCKSMEMTGEILPGSLENFSVDSKYLINTFDPIDLDEDGIDSHVLGMLPLFKSPIAMRPHFTEAWAAQILEKNKLAEAEFEREMQIEVDDEIVADSSKGLHVSLNLLNIISANMAEQDNPVYIAMRDGQAIECHFQDGKEHFKEVPNGALEEELSKPRTFVDWFASLQLKCFGGRKKSDGSKVGP